jgi:hypothetical protein
MDLIELLEVNRDRLPTGTQKAVVYCERAWEEAGQPCTREPLAEFLDRTLRFCAQVEFRYPKIFLKRLKELQRGQWSPRAAGE